MALVVDNVTSDTITVERNDINKESLEIIVVENTITMMAGNVGIGIGWLIPSLPEEAGFSESLIRHFHFLATGEVRRMYRWDTTATGDDGIDEGPAFLFKGPLPMLLFPGHLLITIVTDDEEL